MLRLALLATVFYLLFLSDRHQTLVSGADGLEDGELNCNDQSAREPYFQHLMAFEDDEGCCGTEKYRIGTGTDFLLKYYDDCNVDPKNESMSYEDCHWTLYECLIKKGTGASDLTLASYVELMATNLSGSKKSAILSTANDLKDKTAAASSNGNKQLDGIKSFFSHYFEAEYEVCTKSSELLPEASKEFVKENWEPSGACMNGILPRIDDIPVHPDTIKCWDAFDVKYPVFINSTVPLSYLKYMCCRFILDGLFSEQDLSSSNFDFKAMYTKIIPTFFSKSVRDQFLNDFLNRTRNMYVNELKSGMSAAMEEVTAFMRMVQEKMLKEVTEPGTSAENMNVFTNMFTINEVYSEIVITERVVCLGPDAAENSRK